MSAWAMGPYGHICPVADTGSPGRAQRTKTGGM